ncbi:putative bifunctional diguanylate cyclase/phosphodiesterase [Sphingomonas profundi]|uniref:putative bifunctional diguanylate cyclase/phosphodiesterase n=1 Tax=Alterirhizorhabdus profundi TaxID=2681549 RepID=UPI001E5EFA0A|nr:EAL domain-containing protein [Sphingomonas profundi]
MKRLPATTLRLQLDFRTVLGLVDPDLPNWKKVRAAQLAELRRMLPIAWATNVFNGIVLASVLAGNVPAGQVIAWLAGLLGIVALAFKADRARSRKGVRTVAGALMRPVLRATVCGMLWAVAPVLFGAGAGPDQQIAICLVLGGMIASAPITLSAVPLPMMCFVAPIAIGLTVMMARTSAPILAVLPAVYAASVAFGGVFANRAALRRRWAETALEEEAGLVSLLLREFEEGGADWLWEIDVRKRLVDVSPRLAQAFGLSVDALRGTPLIGALAEGWLPHGDAPTELRALLDLLDARQSFKDHVLPVWIAGERRWWRLSAAPRFEGDGRFGGFRGVGSDVTEQRLSLERIDRLARADGLTEIDNRMGFTERLRGAIEAATGEMPCALILVDLDRFKAVNDNYGHPIGDRLLRAVAGRLRGLIGNGGACGRLGGDEFALLIADARDLEAIDSLCRRIQRALTQPFEIEGHVLQVGASIGTALSPRDGGGVETLMRNADLALYRAKRGGRGMHQHFVPALLDRAERRLALERDLRAALERDELSLVYQPVVAIADNSLTGFEALLRWHHPDHGDVAPSEFVPIAGAARLMGPIGEWVLHTACRQAAHWPDHVHVSINLSAGQVLDARLPMAVRAALALSGLSPARLQLEIPESALLDGGDALTEAIDRIRATGVRLALDDFGTGFGCIREARFSTVKIARPYLTGSDGAPANVALVRALVTMADALGVVTTAKGAETDDQQALALQLGCRQMQGYVSGPPLSADAARALAETARPERRDVA